MRGIAARDGSPGQGAGRKTPTSKGDWSGLSNKTAARDGARLSAALSLQCGGRGLVPPKVRFFLTGQKALDLATFWRYRKPVKLDYDPAKRAWTLEHRQLDFVDARLVWAGPHFDFADAREDYGEARVCTVGFVRGRMVMVVWVGQDDGRRVISMRRCNEREQARYRPYIP